MVNPSPIALHENVLTYNTIQYKLFNVPYIASESEARMVFLGGYPAKYYPPSVMCAVWKSVCALLCLVFIIAVHLGNEVIFTSYHR